LCATRDSFPAYNPPTKCELAVNGATDLGTILYNHYQDSLNNVFEDSYLRKCLKIAGRETFTVSDSSSEYHYTLYYYDQAGNLVKTVPQITFPDITLDSLVQLLKDKPITSLSIRSNLPIEFTKDNRPQSGLSVELQNVYNPVLKGNSVDSFDLNVQKDMLIAEEEINILKSRIEEQRQTEQLFQKQKREAQRQYDSIYQAIQSPDLATKEKAMKDVQSAKTHLAQFQNHTYNPTTTLKIAQDKLNFLRSKQRIYKLQTVSGFMEYFIIKE
jgi:hypothetical protein